MKNIIKSIVLGIGWGFTVFVVYLTIGVFISSDFLAGIAQDDFIKYVICSAVIGLGFSVPSLIYRNERISRGLQVIIHLGTGFAIYVPVAFFAGWIPTAYGAMQSIVISIVTTSRQARNVLDFCFFILISLLKYSISIITLFYRSSNIYSRQKATINFS